MQIRNATGYQNVIRKNMLYKYRGVSGLKYFLEIFVNNKLYAGPYTELNDPMEGLYKYRESVLSGDQLSAIKGEKEKVGILSLSKRSDNQLMWSHYAEGHKGVAIGVRIKDKNCETREIEYTGLSSIGSRPTDGPYETALNILSRKLDIWEYEEEVRVFTRGKSTVNIEIIEVVFGCKMTKKDIKFFTKLLTGINSDIFFRVFDINSL